MYSHYIVLTKLRAHDENQYEDMANKINTGC